MQPRQALLVREELACTAYPATCQASDLLLAGGWEQVVLGVRQADHHGLHAVLAAAREDAEEVDPKGARQLARAPRHVQLLHHRQAQPCAPHPVSDAPPAPACAAGGSVEMLRGILG